MTSPPPIDHLGWDVTRLSRLWAARYATLMAGAGFPWATEARASLLAHLGRDGTAQADLAARAGLTKQAVQQHLDGLIADGLVRRVDDPGDKRRKIVVHTDAGRAAIVAGDRIKQRIEDELSALIGRNEMARLRATLVRLADALDSSENSSS